MYHQHYPVDKWWREVVVHIICHRILISLLPTVHTLCSCCCCYCYAHQANTHTQKSFSLSLLVKMTRANYAPDKSRLFFYALLIKLMKMNYATKERKNSETLCLSLSLSLSISFEQFVIGTLLSSLLVYSLSSIFSSFQSSSNDICQLILKYNVHPTDCLVTCARVKKLFFLINLIICFAFSTESSASVECVSLVVMVVVRDKKSDEMRKRRRKVTTVDLVITQWHTEESFVMRVDTRGKQFPRQLGVSHSRTSKH